MILPIAFVCYIGGQCVFYTPGLVKDEQVCQAMTNMAEVKIQQDKNVKGYQLDCLKVGSPV